MTLSSFVLMKLDNGYFFLNNARIKLDYKRSKLDHK